MPQPTSIIDEFLAAARGFVALLTGNRQAATHFDFSQRGMVGGIIALLVASTITAFGPQVLGVPGDAGIATRSLILGTSLFAIQIGAVYLFLRQIGRLDGFVPFLVADTWMSLFVSVITVVALSSIGAGDFVLVAIGLMAIVIEVNIARLIVTLSLWQIITFIVVQFVGQFLGVLLLAGFFPGAVIPAV